MSTMTPFQSVRNYLAGQVIGITRDDALLHELLKLLLCMSGKVDPDYDEVGSRWASIRAEFPSLFESNEQIRINRHHFDQIAPWLTEAISNPKSDVFGDLYEVFASDIMKAAGGQYFTPRVAVNFLVEAIAPTENETVIDPACGAGGFLAEVAETHLRNGVNPEHLRGLIRGIEKDEYLSNLALSRIGVLTGHSSTIINGDSLSLETQGGPIFEPDKLRSDVVLTNPPFGAKIVAASEAVQKKFELGYKHRRVDGEWESMPGLQTNVSPQVLFIERIVDLVNPGGRVGMVLPESLISSKSHGYLVQYLKKHLHLKAVIGMPESLFKLSGKTGTHTKTVLVIAKKPMNPGTRNKEPVFMAEARHVGKDSRGRMTDVNDLPIVLKRFKAGFKETYKSEVHLGYWVPQEELSTDVLAPRYYDPEASSMMAALKKTHEFVKISDLLANKTIEIKTGDEVGRAAYGTGDVPFVRTSDISNWEIKFDPKHCVSEAVFTEYSKKQDIREKDILMVRDGTYLIGSTAIITKYDTRSVYQSHIMKIRVLNPNVITPYLLLAVFSSEPVLAQIKAKRITQDIIDTLGDRISEIVLPIPKDLNVRQRISQMVERSIDERIEARELARQARALVA